MYIVILHSPMLSFIFIVNWLSFKLSFSIFASVKHFRAQCKFKSPVKGTFGFVINEFLSLVGISSTYKIQINHLSQVKHSVRQQLTKLKDKIINILLIQVREFTVSSFALVCSKRKLCCSKKRFFRNCISSCLPNLLSA